MFWVCLLLLEGTKLLIFFFVAYSEPQTTVLPG